jgi:structure-specific recognition protein 1
LHIHQSAAAKKQKKDKAKDPNEPKKPLSAYFIWIAASRSQLKADFPDLNGKPSRA